jgi:Zn-dependent peptidase ImmA (M78 family)
VELHLKLAFVIRNLRSLFGFGDVHGAIWIRDKRIAVDEQLDPTKNPAKRGRYHFTLAHEVGHWRLHRKYFLKPEGQLDLFGETEPKPNYICRSSEKKLPVEWQADAFAARLLMPRAMILTEWENWRGSLDPIILTELSDGAERLQVELMRRGGGKLGAEGEADMILENACRPFADLFQVSAEAMRIRAEEMQLLLREKTLTLF